MGKQHGKFVWFELFTADIERAKVFYTELLGWKVEPMEMGPEMTYDLIKHGDSGIGGFMKPPQEGGPSHWMSYLSVANVDAKAKDVVAAGGKQLGDAFDVPGVGRIAPVSDPQGGAFCLFSASGDDPSGSEGPGSWHWNELWAKDDEAALKFYEGALGFSHEDMPMGGEKPYRILKQGDAMCGLMQSPAADVPVMWLPYVQVADCDATVERAKSLGAEVKSPAQDIPNVGRFAILQDPVGAVIAVMKPHQGG